MAFKRLITLVLVALAMAFLALVAKASTEESVITGLKTRTQPGRPKWRQVRWTWVHGATGWGGDSCFNMETRKFYGIHLCSG